VLFVDPDLGAYKTSAGSSSALTPSCRRSGTSPSPRPRKPGKRGASAGGVARIPVIRALVVGSVIVHDRVPQIRQHVVQLGPAMFREHVDGVVGVAVGDVGDHLW
jgi:hypothetical protein